MKWVKRLLGGLVALIAIAFVALSITIGYTSDCPTDVAAGSGDVRVVVHRCYGGPEVMRLESIEKPAVGDDDVLVKVHAASVNPYDWHFLKGTPYILRLLAGIGSPDEIRLGSDFSGVVEEVGKDVTRVGPGDRVYGAAYGAFGEYVTVSGDRSWVQLPDNVSYEDAAALPIAAVTALQALRDVGHVGEGSRVLINGASGGVGTYAVQIAKWLGAEVSGVCSTRNVDLVYSLGADRVFDYKQEDFTKSGEVFDVIIDNVGNHSLSALQGSLTENGILVSVGGPDTKWYSMFARPIGAAIKSAVGDQQLKGMIAKFNTDDLDLLAQLVSDGVVQSVVDKRYTLEETPDAMEHSLSGRARGKIIVNVLPAEAGDEGPAT